MIAGPGIVVVAEVVAVHALVTVITQNVLVLGPGHAPDPGVVHVHVATLAPKHIRVITVVRKHTKDEIAALITRRRNQCRRAIDRRWYRCQRRQQTVN